MINSNKIKVPIVLLILIIVGFLLRYIKLDQIPLGFNWDEASVGYNAYSLSKTGKDEFGKSWPLFIESFGDYKTSLYSILIIPIINNIGLSIYSVRILNVFIGISIIPIMYFLALHISQNKVTALIAAILATFSPLEIHLSRFALEWHAMLPLFLVACIFLFNTKKWLTHLPLAALFFGSSLYWYHSIRLFLPFFLLAFFIVYKKQLLHHKKTVIISLVIGLISIIPLLISMWHNHIFSGRPASVAIFNDSELQLIQKEGVYRSTVLSWPVKQLFTNKLVYYGQEIFYRYINHFSLDFLFFGVDATPRISIYPIGKLQLICLPFIIIGLIIIIKSKKREHKMLLAWILLAPLPAAITQDAPHGLRSLLLIPGLWLLTAIGVIKSYRFLKLKISKWQLLIISLITISVFFFETSQMLFYYFAFYPETTANDWQADQQVMVEKLNQYQSNYTRILLTPNKGQPHIFLAFFTPIDPYVYQQQITNSHSVFNGRVDRLGKIEFINPSLADFCQKDTLIITQDQFNIKDLQAIDQVNIPNRFHTNQATLFFYDTNQTQLHQYYCFSDFL